MSIGMRNTKVEKDGKSIDIGDYSVKFNYEAPTLDDSDFSSLMDEWASETSFSFSGSYSSVREDVGEEISSFFHQKSQKRNFIFRSGWILHPVDYVMEGSHFTSFADIGKGEVSISGKCEAFYKLEYLEWKASHFLIEDKRWRDEIID